MILKTKGYMGFLRHDFLNWTAGNKKLRSLLIELLDRTSRSTLSDYAIPYKVAPQQSLIPLHITFDTKIQSNIIFLTLHFPHCCYKFTPCCQHKS